MRNRLAIAVLGVAVSLLTSIPLIAHHGGAAFAVGQEVTLKGTVAEYLFTNPHILVTLDVKGEDGQVVRWVVETQSPQVMYPSGYRKDSFKPGDQVSIVVQPVKTGRPVGRIIEATLADGKKLTRIRFD